MIRRLILFVAVVFGLTFNYQPANATGRHSEVNPKGPHNINIPYSGGFRISYDLNSGTYSVYRGQKMVLSAVYSSVKYLNDTITSRLYTSRRYSVEQITDAFGKGQKHTITLTGKGLPQMKQVFYTYTGRPYFLTETVLYGEGIQSNYIAPVIGDMVKLTGDVRTVFVPFDNDTFISYNAKAFTDGVTNTSAEVGTVYDNNSRNGLVTGSVEHGVWKTGVSVSAGNTTALKVWAGYTEDAITRDNIAHGMVKGQHFVSSPKIYVGYFADWREGLEDYGKANRLADAPFVFNWTKPTPVGWNSWGVLQEKLTYDKAIAVADFFADSLKAFRTGNTAYIDLDSYWDSMRKGDDYSLLKKFVQHCLSKGLQPGVYWAPFTDWGWKGGADRKAEGGDYTFGQLWTKVGDGYHDIDGARAIDPTHPGTLRRIDYVISRLKACGFKMIKIDFLGHAAAESTHFYDPSVTTGMQAYRKGMEYLISKLGVQMLIYAAISPSLATGRYVHSRRIACDAFKTIDHTRYTLNSVNYGWWQTYLYNYVDADHVVMDHQSEGENRARMLSAVITGTFITGDDFSTHGQWSDHAKQWYQDADFLTMIKNGKAFRPVEGNTGQGTSNMFVRQIGNYYYLAVFNYEKSPKQLVINARRIGLNANKVYQGIELFRKTGISLKGSQTIDMPAADAMVFKFLTK